MVYSDSKVFFSNHRSGSGMYYECDDTGPLSDANCMQMQQQDLVRETAVVCDLLWGHPRPTISDPLMGMQL